MFDIARCFFALLHRIFHKLLRAPFHTTTPHKRHLSVARLQLSRPLSLTSHLSTKKEPSRLRDGPFSIYELFD